MKKRHLVTKILCACGLAFCLTACTSLNYVDDDIESVKISNIQTDENFSLQAVEKTTSDNITVRAGVSQTMLEGALVLYLNLKNNTDTTYKFDVADLSVTSPIGDVTFIAPSSFIEAYQNFEASNYAGMMNAGAALGGFANIQNQYRQTITSSSAANTFDNMQQTSDLGALEKTIAGLQKHTLTQYKFIKPYSEEYYYIFLRKPEEYRLVVNYKDLTYKFGGKNNASE